MKYIFPATVLFCLLVMASPRSLQAIAVPQEEAVDHLSRASIMIYDGQYDLAREELALVDRSRSDFDAARFFTTMGVLDSKNDEDESAIEHFLRAIEETKVKVFVDPEKLPKSQYLFSVGSATKDPNTPKFDPERVRREKLEKLYIYLSQSNYRLEMYARTIEYLDLAESKGRDRSALFLLRADCYWKMKDSHRAIEALTKGTKYFPADPAPWQQKVRYFSELGLYQSAIDAAKMVMELNAANEADSILLSQLYVRTHQYEKAIHLLEKLKAHYPESAKMRMLLGQFYLEMKMPRTTASLFQEGAIRDESYMNDAVEMMRRTKSYPQATYLNSQMSDNSEKLRQKVAIYLDRAEYEKVIGLKDGLERYNILDDDSMRYALAYAHFMSKDYVGAEEYLRLIEDQELFMMGTVIRNNIEKCRSNSVECL